MDWTFSESSRAHRPSPFGPGWTQSFNQIPGVDKFFVGLGILDFHLNNRWWTGVGRIILWMGLDFRHNQEWWSKLSSPVPPLLASIRIRTWTFSTKSWVAKPGKCIESSIWAWANHHHQWSYGIRKPSNQNSPTMPWAFEKRLPHSFGIHLQPLRFISMRWVWTARICSSPSSLYCLQPHSAYLTVLYDVHTSVSLKTGAKFYSGLKVTGDVTQRPIKTPAILLFI